MNGQQIQALLGQWYDVVGRAGGGGGGGGGGGRAAATRHDRGGRDAHRDRRRPRDDRWGYPYPMAYPYGYGYGYPAYAVEDEYDDQPQYQYPVPAQYPAPVPTATAGALFHPDGAYPFPPRAAVVDAPLPTKANRDILPMSTGVPILPTQSAQITGRPQTLVYCIGRFVISNAGTAGGAADWIVNDIKIGNRSQFVQSGDVPGDLFATNAIDTFVRFDSAQTAMDVVVVVTYIGLNESGCPFFGAMVGTAAV
jgi:hypothetical protein